ncbi:MAG: uroporphyrinogen decarboxylase [Lawsonibacter sp.]|nr:uroporphyrinogen decarboxylase [Lawsonibacter sp.]
MTKKERILAAIRGEKPDKMPYSFWSHMPGTDLDPEAIAQKTYEFYQRYDFDFVKTMNNGMYAIEDFGCTVDYSEIVKGGVAKVVSTPVAAPEDWYKLKVCPCDQGSNARELRHLSLVLEKLGGEVPVIFTVFSPITIADKICGGRLMSFINEGHGQQVKAALEVITQTTAQLAAEAIRLGADGVFFASQMSTYDKCTTEQYLEYGKPYDLQVLAAAKDGWMNTIHCHGSNIMFQVLKDYPVQIFNWHVWETLPDLDEAFALTGKCLMGGLNRTDITNRNFGAVQNQIYRCFKQMGGRHQILTPGCVIRYPLDDEMLRFIGETRTEVEAVFDCL